MLLYRGGAKADATQAGELIASGALGDPQFDRLELVCKLHEEISAALGSGGSRVTAASQIQCVRHLFGFGDRTNRPMSLKSITETYCAWGDSLLHRTRMQKVKATVARARAPDRRPLTMSSAYCFAATVGALLDRVLERHTHAVELVPLERPKRRKTAAGVQADKQNLSDTFAFGHLLQDICDGLSLQALSEASHLPTIQIPLRIGKILTRNGGTSCPSQTIGEVRPGIKNSLVNLRIEAELFMFIGQTGMNREQAANLKLQHFFYVSHLDGYQVKEHKSRRGGDVLFEIFKDYKAHLERYLDWRRNIFPDSNRLFPFIGTGGSRPEERFDGGRLRAVCKKLNIPYISPRSLRGTRVNWLLRRSKDPDQTAEMAQHTKETLLSDYHKPSLQLAMVEVTHFWSAFDPLSKKTEAVAPGRCTGEPKVLANFPKGATKPNCINASGCLWCEKHRDVDSLDYVWALATFGHLKLIELSKTRTPNRNDVPPAKHAIDRIHEKLRWFEQSNEARRAWVEEACARIAEGDFHPNFRCEIEELEGTV
ncbi:site-specific integrase [Burkholderia pseudomallei]|uniref:site-specific integrase n=1 Tax=Burkholderia pseudomallei TaxID=28450 RepID=UPI001AD60C48|nr:site-specific integrase [Burkholderia pseudomallei]MBO7822127.1 site-specific integrase [Burkholderia pseudomallei]